MTSSRPGQRKTLSENKVDRGLTPEIALPLLSLLLHTDAHIGTQSVRRGYIWLENREMVRKNDQNGSNEHKVYSISMWCALHWSDASYVR